MCSTRFLRVACRRVIGTLSLGSEVLGEELVDGIKLAGVGGYVVVSVIVAGLEVAGLALVVGDVAMGLQVASEPVALQATDGSLPNMGSGAVAGWPRGACGCERAAKEWEPVLDRACSTWSTVVVLAVSAKM